MLKINQKTIVIISIILLGIFLLFSLKKCNSTVLDQYKTEQIQKLEKEYRVRESVLLDSIRGKDVQYAALEKDRNRLDSLRKISKETVRTERGKKEKKLEELNHLSVDSQVTLLKSNLDDSNVYVLNAKVSFDSIHIPLINYKFLEASLQKEELKAVYTDMILCDSAYQALDTMLTNREGVIALKDSTIAVKEQITQEAINLRENYKKQLKKEKRGRLIDNILIPSLTGLSGVGLGYLIFKSVK